MIKKSGDEAAVYGRVLAELVEGVPEAEGLISPSVRSIATVLLGLANILDLDWIELTGPGFAATRKRYINEVKTLIENASFTRGVQTIAVEPGGTGPEVAALGAASVVLHRSPTPHRIRAWGGGPSAGDPHPTVHWLPSFPVAACPTISGTRLGRDDGALLEASGLGSSHWGGIGRRSRYAEPVPRAAAIGQYRPLPRCPTNMRSSSTPRGGGQRLGGGSGF